MNSKYATAKQCLKRWIEDPRGILQEQKTIFQDNIHPNEVGKALFNVPLEEQQQVLAILQALTISILDVINRQLSTQLPGGEFWDPSPELQEASSSCVAHNISGERNFAMVDSHLHKAPNISIGKVESKVMFKTKNGWKVKVKMRIFFYKEGHH